MERILDLHNQTFKVGFNGDPPNTVVENGRVTAGLEARLLAIFSKCFNFTYEMFNCHDMYGTRLANGTWNGVIGRIVSKELDMAIGGIIMTGDRMAVIDYLDTHWIDGMSFITSRPHNEVDFRMLVQPFSRSVWLVFLLAVVALSLFDHLKWRLTDAGKGNLFWIGLGLVFRQPTRHLQTINAGMIMWAAVWIIGTMILATVYSGNLYSILTIPAKSAIDSVAKLVVACRQQRITVLVMANTSIYEILSMDTFHSIWQTIVLVASDRHGAQMVVESSRNGSNPAYALISSRNSLRWLQMIQGRDWIFLPPNRADSIFLPILLALPVAKTFPYKKQFNQIISRLVSAGILRGWLMKEMLPLMLHREVEYDDRDPNGPSEQFSFDHIGIIFNLYLIGLGLAFGIFLTELGLYSHRKEPAAAIGLWQKLKIHFTIVS